MNRRKLLKRSMLLGIMAIMDLPEVFSRSGAAHFEGNRVHQFNLGDLDIKIISDGHVIKKTVQPSFAPGFDPAEVNKVLHDNFASASEIDLAVNILLFKYTGHLILIDTGCGHLFGKDTGWLVQNLKSNGVSSEEITDIIITHAHPDHIGGVTSESGELIFKNAALYLSKADHDFWMSSKPDFSKSRMESEKDKRDLVSVAQANIKAACKRLYLFNDGDEILGCMRAKLAPGHTPGHTVLKIHSRGESLYHIADLVHAQALTFDRPDWGVDSDVDYELAIVTRKRVLGELSALRANVFAYHLPWPGLGNVRKKQSGFDWVEKTYALPD